MGWVSDIRMSVTPLAGFLAVGIAWASFSAQVPVLKAQIGASDGVYGSVVLVSSIGALLAMWLAPLTRRLAGRWALIVGALAMGAGFVCAGFAGGIILFALAMGLAAAGSGIADVLANAEVSEREAESGRSLMNLNHGLYSFAYAGAALATGWAREAGWGPVAIFAVSFAVIGVLALVMRLPEDGEMLEEDRATFMPHLLVWLGGAVVLTAFLAEAATEGWSALHLERTLGGGPAEGAMGPAILGLTMGIGRLFGHALAQRMSDIRLMAVACCIAALGTAIAGAAPTLGWAYLGFGLGGLGVSVVVPLALALVGRSVPAAARLTAISRAAALGYGAFFLGPPLMGIVAEFAGLRASFYLIALILILTAGVLLPLLSRQVAGAFRMG